jgi:hypothetical protein
LKYSAKKLISYLVYVTILLVIIYAGLKTQHNLLEKGQNNFKLRPFYIYQSVFPLILGIFLGIPYLIRSFLSEGRWSLAWLRVLILGLPFLYLAILPVLYSLGAVSVRLPFSNYAMGGYFGPGTSGSFVTINGIIAGYILITSIEKRKDSSADKKEKV